MKKFIAAIVLCIIAAAPQSAFAASLDLTAECAGSIAEGETLTVDIKYSSDYLDSVNGSVRYDTDSLEYLSGGSSTGDGGLVKLKGSADDGKTVAFTLSFKALKTGTAAVEISTDEAYDLDGKAMNTPYVTRNITIEDAPADKNAGSTEASDKNDTADSDAGKDKADAAPDENLQTQNNSRLLMISAGITAALLAAVSIIAGVRKKKKNRDRQH